MIRSVWARVILACAAAGLAACSSEVVACSPCAGFMVLSSRDLFAPEEQPTSVRVCIETTCTDRSLNPSQDTVGPVAIRPSQHVALVTVAVIEDGKVLRTVRGKNLVAPDLEPAADNSCSCVTYVLGYDRESKSLRIG